MGQTISTSLVHEALARGERVKLEIGAGDGRRRSEGFYYQDIQPYPGIHLVCDAANLDRVLPSDSLIEISATHILEHFGHQRTLGVLRAWWDVLKPGGSLYLECPNLRWHADLLYGARTLDDLKQVVRYVYGDQSDDCDVHKAGFTKELLDHYLHEAGFVDIRIDPQTSHMAWAKKREDGKRAKDV